MSTAKRVAGASARCPDRVTPVRYRPLGMTGMNVSTYCLGAMMFGEWGNPDHEDSVRIIHAALDAGINFVDTADVYSQGESEEIVGVALKGRRDEVVLATKVHGQMGAGLNRAGNSRRWITRAVEDSLRRLQTDWIDLYQIHRPDPKTDVEETLAALTDLQRAGKIRTFGSSTFPAELVVEAQWTAERRGLGRFRCEQPPYSLLARGIERSVLPTCQRYGMGVIVWSPLAGGWLSGRYRKAEDIDLTKGRAARMPDRFDPSIPANQRKLEVVGRLAEVADDLGIPLSHVAMAFSVVHPAVTSAIIGPRTSEQLDDLLAAASLELDDATLDRLDTIVAPGTDLSPEDTGWMPPWLADPAARRLAQSERAVS
ncbi:MAG: aldo/keto reductase [Acidimicrobiaceae bacterium]|nr:aldo/keto reductase [Acidimicrobiaceae bacterium]